MDGGTTTQFELVSGSGERLRAVFARVVDLLQSASRELEHSQEAAKTSMNRAASLLQAQMRYDSTERQDPSRALLAWQMRRVEGYIEEHIDRQIRVADLSDLVELSVAHFSRAFRLACGEPPHAYIVRRRVELAAQLMLAGREPLSEIALKCGFHDQAHLSKQFRQLTGETPAAWRRLRRRRVNMDFELGSQMIPSASARATA
ncbi:MAG: AraC family transcriptional regulator [Gammaproteobacteria bacterium]|jgi:AraC-like DNA-binding protein|nr:AraC family transcriptional regulator [Gammaproteobacteria bacterium]